jgi:hypothetical protein
MSKLKRKKLDRNNSFFTGYINLLITVAPMLAALAIIFWSKRPVRPFIFSLSFFIAGFTGLIVIIRREIPMIFNTISGLQAIIEGGIVTIFCWGVAIYIYLYGL